MTVNVKTITEELAIYIDIMMKKWPSVIFVRDENNNIKHIHCHDGEHNAMGVVLPSSMEVVGNVAFHNPTGRVIPVTVHKP